jgi:hypothetical protein
MSLYCVSTRGLNQVNLDAEDSAHREFVADCIAHIRNSHSVAVANATDTSVEIVSATHHGCNSHQQPLRLIFCATDRERLRFRNVTPVSFEPIELEPWLLSELGAANLDVLGGAKLMVTFDSALLVSVLNAASVAHAARVLEWALQTPPVAEAVEIAIAERSGDEPGIVSLLAHGMSSASAASQLPPIVEIDSQICVEIVFDTAVTDASGKAMARMIGATLRALMGALVWCRFTSSTRPLLVCSASSKAALEQAWPVIVQVMARSPRDDLPAVTQPRREVVWRLPQPPNESWLCVLQSGCKIDEAAMSQLVELVRGSPNLAVVDLTRAKGDGITAAAVAELLACAHVRFVSIAGAAQCESIRSALGAAHVGRLVWCPFPQCLDEIEDRSGIDWHAHRRFFSFRQAATGSIRDIRGHELFAAAGAREAKR